MVVLILTFLGCHCFHASTYEFLLGCLYCEDIMSCLYCDDITSDYLLGCRCCLCVDKFEFLLGCHYSEVIMLEFFLVLFVIVVMT